MKLSIDVKGVRGLQRRLSAYEREVKRQVMFTIQATATTVRDDAKAEAPVGPSGNLRNSIRTDFQQLDRLYAEVLTALEYARRQEYGFTGTDALGRTYDQPGRFFMTKAAEKNKKPFRRNIEAALRRARQNTLRP